MPGSGRIARFWLTSDDGRVHGVARFVFSPGQVRLDWQPTDATDATSVRGDQTTNAVEFMQRWFETVTQDQQRTA